MKREFLFERQGKQVVLYAGLLDLAHERGLKSIRTEMLQAPTKDNGEMSIFRATVEMADGTVFQGTGDATPQNVGRTIVPHAARMAETRAKARALRDALNINAVSLEEMGDDDEPARPAPTPRPQPPTAPRPAAPDPEMLERQRQARAMNPPTEAAARPDARLGRDPGLIDLWSSAEASRDALASVGLTPAALPADEANEATLTAYVGAARRAYAAKKAGR